MAISRQVMDCFDSLYIHYIVHHDGQLTEALGVASHEILHHPAAQTALHLLTHGTTGHDSSLLGTAVAQKKLFLGLSRETSYMALCTLNLDQFKTLTEARREAYRLAWHAIDTIKYRDHTYNVQTGERDIIVRKRNALQMGDANLHADIFSAFMCALQKDSAAIEQTAKMRAANVLSCLPGHLSHLFPYPLAMDTTYFAYAKQQNKHVLKNRMLPLALKMTENIAQHFDQDVIKSWLLFSEAAQDMAWQGFSQEDILSAAINTSDNTQVRSAGYLVSELTGIEPAPIFSAMVQYSAFADSQFNEKLHDEMVQKVFEDVIAQGLKLKSISPFLDTANLQNERLVFAQTLGWCAEALQDSAKVFEQALSSGGNPETSARQRFEERQKKTLWEDLEDLGRTIVKRNRDGETVTMDALPELCKNKAGLAAIKKSMDRTLSQPAYRAKMEAAGPRGLTSLSPAGPGLKAPPTITPRTPGLGPSVQAPPPPGLGLGGKPASPPPRTPPVENTTTQETVTEQRE
ncbi:MAG: hypothetical protein H6868_08975 [Rhodospirillales bacterium]|nr:hypothetical protein [Rhodospirillales bacterium]